MRSVIIYHRCCSSSSLFFGIQCILIELPSCLWIIEVGHYKNLFLIYKQLPFHSQKNPSQLFTSLSNIVISYNYNSSTSHLYVPSALVLAVDSPSSIETTRNWWAIPSCTRLAAINRPLNYGRSLGDFSYCDWMQQLHLQHLSNSPPAINNSHPPWIQRHPKSERFAKQFPFLAVGVNG